MATKTDIKINQKNDKMVKEHFKVKQPKNYRIILLNNDITAYEAVIDVLIVVFNKSQAEASQIMFHANNTGRSLIVAPVTKEIGEGKCKQAEDYCEHRENEIGNRYGRFMYYNELKFEVEED